MPNNQYERDFNDLGALKRPGRLDFRILNNVDDAGDGHPGLQKAIRNYFHEGYLEKDINMNTHKIINLQAPSGNNDGARKVDVDTVQNDLDGFTDELKNLTTHEIQQLETLGEIITISEPQWGYLGASNQGVATTSNVAFNQITMSGNIIMGANNITLGIDQTVDGVDVDSHTHGGAGQGGTIAFSSLSGDIVYTQLDSIVDIAGTGATNLISRADHLHTNVDGSSKIAHANTTGRTANDHHSQSHVLSGGDHTASGLTTGYVIRATTATTFAWTQLGHGDLSEIGSNAHSVIDTHLSTDVIKIATDVQGVSVGGNFSGTVGSITHGSTQRCTLNTSYLPLAGGQMIGNITFSGTETVDGVDVSAIKLNSMPSAANGDITCNSQKLINVSNPTADSHAVTKGVMFKYINPVDIHGILGWSEGINYWTVSNSDSDSIIGGSIIVPETRTDWKVLFINYGPPTYLAYGKLSVGSGGSGEVASENNIFDATAFNLTNSGVGGSKYQYKLSSAFSSDVGDVLRIKWDRDGNSGTGTIYLVGIFLVH